MKVMTILGTRPEIIHLSRIIPKLDRHCHHVLVHTGQNKDFRLSGQFFDQLRLREPDHHLGLTEGGYGDRLGRILSGIDDLMSREKPDRVLVLGDTDSGMSALVAKRRSVPVYHMEAGNRCYDDRVPEEVNRRVIDHCSDVLLPYTDRSRHNLLREGLPSHRVLVTGNPIWEIIQRHQDAIERSSIMETLRLTSEAYYLVTAHRAETVDNPVMLEQLCQALKRLADETQPAQVVFSVHPRTKQRLADSGLSPASDRVMMIDPPGFFDFVALERQSLCVLTDSGTVQEECCLLHTPCVILRDVTERPEVVECGCGTLAGVDPETVLRSVGVTVGRTTDWLPPPEYLATDVSDRVLGILLGGPP